MGEPARVLPSAHGPAGDRDPEFDRASMEQRADVMRLNGVLKEQLQARGLVFEAADKPAFRKDLSDKRLLQDLEGQVRLRGLEGTGNRYG